MNTKLNLLMLLLIASAVFAIGCSTMPTTNSTTSVLQSNANSTPRGNSTMNHNGMPMNTANHNMPAMTGEMKSDNDAAAQPYDLQFIDTMMHHHEGAVQMSEMVLRRSQNDELKKFAQKIIDDQQKEIARMKEWREKWYAGKPPAKNMEMPGMMDSMKTMAGNDFDVHFLAMMSPHHEGAVTMSKDALQKAEHAEIKTLANQIVKAQEDEIKRMNEWKEKWAK
jgi:uncharacterized protein (DUF305 family)